jgi:hypothetical protein
MSEEAETALSNFEKSLLSEQEFTAYADETWARKQLLEERAYANRKTGAAYDTLKRKAEKLSKADTFADLRLHALKRDVPTDDDSEPDALLTKQGRVITPFEKMCRRVGKRTGQIARRDAKILQLQATITQLQATITPLQAPITHPPTTSYSSSLLPSSGGQGLLGN